MEYKINYNISVRNKNNEEWEELIDLNVKGSDIAELKKSAKVFIPNILDTLCKSDKEVLIEENIEDENGEYVDHDEWFSYFKDKKLILEDEMI